eukprot:CAMPEP_0119148352 /NCGR_PEP_ID=MMETSP1310-20130426/41708_1 /TAXON_ID=464262 /ORGANISM="Genus nov. species nov., Strain RCC2339" /LENGTH=1200 /DNA_ID=CAMNT_0007140381 /DNA_START=89 /DNA_END=3691 /DNA_ORIENTATION=+
MLWIFVLQVLVLPCAGAVPQEQSTALALFYQALNGPLWKDNTNWLSGDPCAPGASWYGLLGRNGVGCTGDIVAINFVDNGLDGTLPEIFSLFNSTERILLRDDNIRGSMPSSFFLMDSLTDLELANLHLSGTLPTTMGARSTLRSLRVSSKFLYLGRISGSIPPSIGELTNLEVLQFRYTDLDPTFPPGMSNLTNMVEFNMYSTMSFPGNPPPGMYPFPDFFCLYPHLQVLAMELTSFSSTLPSCLGTLSEMYVLKLNANRLSGEMPTEIGNLEKLILLEVSNNSFEGTVPKEWRGLTRLTEMRLDRNLLSGTLPPELEKLTMLQTLVISSNQFSGSFPSEWKTLTRLLYMYLSSNYLDGSLPTGICGFPEISNAYFDQNRFSGSIPPCYGEISTLKVLTLASNDLEGVLPSFADSGLLSLIVNSNNLSGSLPYLPKTIVSVAMIGNSLSGSIPEQWLRDKQLSMLVVLDIQRNALSGSISPELLRYPYLRNLYVNNNRFSGHFQSEDACNLRSFSLAQNLFDCPMPSCCDYRETCQAHSKRTSHCCSDFCLLAGPAQYAPPPGGESATHSLAVGTVSFGLSLLLLCVTYGFYRLRTSSSTRHADQSTYVYVPDEEEEDGEYQAQPMFYLLVGRTSSARVVIHLRTVHSVVVLRKPQDVAGVLKSKGIRTEGNAAQWSEEYMKAKLCEMVSTTVRRAGRVMGMVGDKDPIFGILGGDQVLREFFLTDGGTGVEAATFASKSDACLHQYFEEGNVTVLNPSGTLAHGAENPVGQGLTSQVFKGMWYGSEVAVKVMTLGEHGRGYESACLEAAIQDTLLHPNIVSLFGIYAKYQGSYCVTYSMTMEWLPYTIHDLLYDRRLRSVLRVAGVPARCDLAHKIAVGVKYLHDNDILHRDISAVNIFLDEALANVKIGDFGSAAFTDALLPNGNGYVGTPRYSAPEVVLNGEFGVESDMYALGVVCWEIYLARRPYADVSSDSQVLGAIAKGEMPFEIPNRLYSITLNTREDAMTPKETVLSRESADLLSIDLLTRNPHGEEQVPCDSAGKVRSRAHLGDEPVGRGGAVAMTSRVKETTGREGSSPEGGPGEQRVRKDILVSPPSGKIYTGPLHRSMVDPIIASLWGMPDELVSNLRKAIDRKAVSRLTLPDLLEVLVATLQASGTSSSAPGRGNTSEGGNIRLQSGQLHYIPALAATLDSYEEIE